MATNTNQAFQDCIQQYLNNRAEADPLFAVKLANPSKNIVECCQYIASEVYKMGVNGVDDDTVYGLACHYIEDDVEVNDKLNYKAVCNHHVELTDEEKAEARQKAIDQLQREEADRLRRKAERPKAQQLQQAQPSLFDF